MMRPFAALPPLVAALSLVACAAYARPAPHADPPVRAQPVCPPLADAATVAVPAEGCLNEANLAKMVADPDDLAAGKPLGATDGARQAVIVESYRENHQSALPSQGSPTPTFVMGGSTGGGGQ